jgi:hypothetical protein
MKGAPSSGVLRGGNLGRRVKEKGLSSIGTI